MGPLCIDDPQNGGHNQEIRRFGQFLPQIGDFTQKPWVNLSILCENWIFFKTCKNLYTGPLGITDPQYGQEIRSFGQFLSPELAILVKNRRLTPMDFVRELELFKTCKNSYTGQPIRNMGSRPRNTEFRSILFPN